MCSDYKMNDENVQDYKQHEQMIKTVSDRFKTYGYQRIKTPAFEEYDLYSKVKSSINQNEMIKVIDRTGEVLVLRPDVTIPITKKLARDYTKLPDERRYFYVQDIFRQPNDDVNDIESTQAGVEYFCETSPEADAEVIALAIDTLTDLGFTDVKIEMGHAGFFQEIIDILQITTNEIEQLKELIQAKNVVEIDPYLRKLDVRKEVREVVEKIPFLYGDPVEVSKRALDIALTPEMKEKINYLVRLFEILKMYGCSQHIVLDLGLINHMGYYSDVIFQGFIEKYGKPVLMGGRYNELGREFEADIPAIGFACKIESLIEAVDEQQIKAVDKPQMTFPGQIVIKVIYTEAYIKESIDIANIIRNQDVTAISLPKRKEDVDQQKAKASITLSEEGYFLHSAGETFKINSMSKLEWLLEGDGEGLL